MLLFHIINIIIIIIVVVVVIKKKKKVNENTSYYKEKQIQVFCLCKNSLYKKMFS